MSYCRPLKNTISLASVRLASALVLKQLLNPDEAVD
jgi:hypothetical protein